VTGVEGVCCGALYGRGVWMLLVGRRWVGVWGGGGWVFGGGVGRGGVGGGGGGGARGGWAGLWCAQSPSASSRIPASNLTHNDGTVPCCGILYCAVVEAARNPCLFIDVALRGSRQKCGILSAGRDN